ncbi:MAG TPA: hypothetical protein VHL09_05280 [Dehalococcoidia bacterium]|nr:hypothetical protein [Dehalococcoidia bacterium]
MAGPPPDDSPGPEIGSLMSEVQRAVIDQLARLLVGHDIRFQVTGGLAAIAHGARRPLYDIDLDVGRRDLPAVRRLIEPYLVDDIYRLQDDNFDITLLTAVIDGVTVDVSQAEDAYYLSPDGRRVRLDADLDRAVPRAIAGLTLPVIARDDLIAYKSIIARPTDLIDIEQIVGTTGPGGSRPL